MSVPLDLGIALTGIVVLAVLLLEWYRNYLEDHGL